MSFITLKDAAFVTAYLTLDTHSNLTLSDVAAWLERARALGADDTSPVRLGAPPSAQDRVSESALVVPVTVTLKPLPPSAATRKAAES
jgi:hypothetical protein